VEQNTLRLLDLCAEAKVHGTFFVLGWVAERIPSLVKRIAAAGHELACHSYEHRCIFRLSPQEFREDTRRAKNLIEQAAGIAVRGYRAPSWSITEKSLWALEILVEEGFSYDSSIYPIRHDLYGIPGAAPFAYEHRLTAGRLLEFPPGTIRLLGHTLPAAGGGYLRLLPFWYTAAAIRQTETAGRSLVIYIHPWELDPGQPRIRGRWKSCLRHYAGLASVEKKLKTMLTRWHFKAFADVLANPCSTNGRFMIPAATQERDS
jgi:polysaccharide deacetylase family protein (PEP-CTERM system associated)